MAVRGLRGWHIIYVAITGSASRSLSRIRLAWRTDLREVVTKALGFKNRQGLVSQRVTITTSTRTIDSNRSSMTNLGLMIRIIATLSETGPRSASRLHEHCR